MSEHPNVDLLRRGFAAFAAGDLTTLEGMFADDAIWHVSGRHRFSGDYEGKAAIFQYFREFFQDMDSIVQDVHALLADGEHGVALQMVTATRGDDRLEVNNVLVFHIENGLATEVWVASNDPYAADEFWA